MTIQFYSRLHNGYRSFSNFYERKFVYNKIKFASVEHYFQSMKFSETAPEWAIQVRNAPTPLKAQKLGRNRNYPIHPQWEQIKVSIMKQGLICKFSQNEDLKSLLLSTGEELLLEVNPHDSYWGTGKNGEGKNMMGKLLMEVREMLE